VVEFQRDSQIINDETQVGELLQTWLYFSLLKGFDFRVNIVAFRTNMLTSMPFRRFPHSIAVHATGSEEHDQSSKTL
jgi:hypothetical protein